MKKNNWGGKREGAGRKRIEKELAKNRTKVVRLNLNEYKYIKSGAYRKIVTILQKKRSVMNESKKYKDSPRWAKLWQLMEEIEDVLGKDWEEWI